MSKATHTILRCSACRQQLRVPLDRGELRLTCPKCRHSWAWAPSATTVQGRSIEIFASAEGSEFERCAIVGLMMAIEAEELTKHRATVKTEHELNFLMAYECLMMWAIKSGMEKTLSPRVTESAVVAMQRHVARHGHYRAGAFEKIWASMQAHMPWAMTQQHGGPPPYPAADMLIAANIAGYEIEAKTQEFFDLNFGVYVALMMAKLMEAAELSAKDFQKDPA